jgi:hypothetical protein
VNILYKGAQVHVSILLVLTVIVLFIQLAAEARRTHVRYSLSHLLCHVQLELILGGMETDAAAFNYV